MLEKENEIKIGNNFLLEVRLDEDTGETIVGRTYRGKGFKGIPLMTLFMKADKIGNDLKIASATKKQERSRA